MNQLKAMASLDPIPSVRCDEGSFVYSLDETDLDPTHGLNFANGTEAMLRLDPDYVLIGEIRDAPSAALPRMQGQKQAG